MTSRASRASARRSSRRLAQVLSTAMLAVVAGAALAGERPTRDVPALARAPRLAGRLEGLAGGAPFAEVKPPDATASLAARVATWKEAVVLGVAVKDDQLGPEDVLEVSLHFPGAGLTAPGSSFRFALDGQRTPAPETGAPAFARRQVKATVQRTPGGMLLEASFPARALPRFPARGPMTLELCLAYEDRDPAAGSVRTLSNCVHGSMSGEVLRLPAAFREALKLQPPAEVESLEPREHGWAGHGSLHFPVWALGDRPLDAGALAALVAEEPVEPAAARIAIPSRMNVPGAGRLLVALSGRDPFAGERCDAEAELRFGFYLVQGKEARRALEWPAAACELGRASSVQLDEEGALEIGYSSGRVLHFIFSDGQFERTEIG